MYTLPVYSCKLYPPTLYLSSIADLARFRPKFGTGKYFLFVFGQNQKSGEELRYGPVDLYQPNVDF